MNKVRELLIKSTLLMGAFVMQCDSMVISPNLGVISESFPGISFLWVSMIATFSSVFIAISSMSCGMLSTKVAKKKLLLIGTVLFTIGGTGGGGFISLPYMLAMRAIEGLGAGLTITISAILIPELFPNEDETNKLMGLNSAAIALWGVIISIAAGSIGANSWQAAFNIYLFGLIILVCQLCYIPREKAEVEEKIRKIPRGKVTVQGVSLGLSGFMFSVISTMFFLNIGSLVIEYEIGNAGEAGMAMSITTVGSFVAGLYFAFLRRHLGRFTPAVAYFYMALGTTIPVLFTNLAAIYLGACFFGFGYGIFYPYLLSKAALISNRENLDKNISVVNCLFFLGMFCTSLLIGLLEMIFKMESALFNYKFMSVAFFIFMGMYLVKGIASIEEYHKNLRAVLNFVKQYGGV